MLNIDISIQVSCGELVDKLSILSIKREKVKDVEKLKNINIEYDYLNLVCDKLRMVDEKSFNNYFSELREVNTKLWDIEDNIRKHEKESNFNNLFIELARSVYITNDKRFQIKNSINSAFSSQFREEKDYEDY